MKKSLITLAVAATVGIGTIFAGVVEAESISTLKSQQSDIQNERSDINSDISEADKQINSLKDEQADVKSEMQRIDLAVGATHAKIREITANVEETKAEIARLQKEIEETKVRIEQRNELLKERARNYQLTGGMVSYLDVLLGSNSFSDFIDRASAVATIMQADQDILVQQEADKKALEDNQIKVEQELASVQAMLADLEKMNQQLNSQRAEKNKLLATLVEQEEEIHNHKMGMQEEAQILAAQSAALQKAIKQEQERQAAAAEAAAKAAAAAAAAAASNPSSGGGGTASTAPTTPPPSNGNFVQPANGISTSGFGTRPEFRPGEFHYGVDIANRSAGVPIRAAAAGVVINSYFSGSYGNVIFIAHSINGQTYTTVYAHMEARYAGNGATVKAGQQIGVMGTTGDSTGQHLHFELHKGGWTPGRGNAINPRGIVPLP